MSQERTPILGREVSKPLRPEEYPSEKEITSLTGEVGASRLETVLRTMGIAAPVLTMPILLTACEKIPETPAIVKTPEEVGLQPTPTLEIKTPTAEPTPTEKITPTVTKEPTVTPTPELTPIPTAEKPTPSPTKEPTPTPEPQPPVEMVATGNVDIYLSPDGQKVGYFVPGQRFTPTGAEQDGWIQVRDSDGNTLWIQEGGPYGPAGEVEPPSPACEVPHFPDRTPDRKTGVVIMFGTPRQRIFPDRPYVMQYDRQYIGAPWYTRRDARIIEIDPQNQIITFQLSDGSTRQRRFTQNTQVIMDAHEWYRGMPMSQARQAGGNFCDFEEGDVASILHPDEAESANLNPNLTDLWGVFIVQ